MTKDQWSATPDQISELALKVLSDQPDSYTMSNLYKYALGLCLEASSHTIETLVQDLVRDQALLADGGARNPEDGSIYPVIRDRYTRFLVMNGDRCYVTALTYHQIGASEIRMIRSLYERGGNTFDEAKYRQEHDAAPPDFSEINVVALDSRQELADFLKCDDPTGYHSKKMFGTTRSSSASGENRWLLGHQDLYGNGIDKWQSYFGLLRHHLGRAGLMPYHDQFAAGMTGRDYRWRDNYHGSPDPHSDLRQFARIIAARDNFLPADGAAGIFADIETMHRNHSFNQYAGQFEEVFQLLREGGFSTEEFECNDADDHTRLAIDEDGLEVLLYRGQNNAYAVARSKKIDGLFTEMTILNIRNGSETRRAAVERMADEIRCGDNRHLLARFCREGTREWVMQGRPDVGIDGVRAWTGFYQSLDSVHCCLTEAASRSAPRP